MKKIIAGFVMMVFLAFSASAQEKQNEHHGRHKAKHHRERITKDLNLTDQQKQDLKVIHDNHRTQMAELKKEDISVEEMRDRRAKLAKEHRSAMHRILTLEQKGKIQEQRNKSMEKRQQMQAQRMEKMKKDLVLTDDQSSRLRSINESYRSKFQTLKKNEALNQRVKKEQMQALKEQRREELKKVLTQEQIRKLDEMKKDRGGRKQA
jgi:Spy/CpxP family protein refolding chaperone